MPNGPEDLTPGLLTDILRGCGGRGPRVETVTIVETKGFDDQGVSTSARITAEVSYAGPAEGLPTRLLIKLAKPDARLSGRLYGLYANEVRFYTHFRDEIPVAAPQALGCAFDEVTNRYVIVLEDLTARRVRFPSQLDDVGIDYVTRLLSGLAKMHAAYWQSPVATTQLGRALPHTDGPIADVIDGVVRQGTHLELERHKFKREIVASLGTDEEELFVGVRRVQRHQARLPQTLVHGDCHLGNTYQLPSGEVGFYDWQLFGRAHCMHDVTYAIITSLSIEERRLHERKLLDHYLDRLATSAGRAVCTHDELWTQYRLCAQWCLAIGWLSAPTRGYGWEHLVVALLRTSAACADLGTVAAVGALR